MDPDATLARILVLTTEIKDRPNTISVHSDKAEERWSLWDATGELVELVESLDYWILNGGFLPKAWQGRA